MPAKKPYKYLIVGAGTTANAAIEGIRETDRTGAIALFGEEKYLPYDRPPLTKKLWFGKMKEEQVFFHNWKFYEDNNVELMLGTTIISVDPVRKVATDQAGASHYYDKLLLATGGSPRKLSIPGGNLDGICYYRYLDDYQRIKTMATEGKSAVVIGGGFIGSEIAAALTINKVKATMLFPETYLCNRVLPSELAETIQAQYIKKGVQILNNDRPTSISMNGEQFVTQTEKGTKLVSDILIVGIGIEPETKLAKTANLKVNNGIVVNEYLKTSSPDIYAAGDNANFPCRALNKELRFEHWDNALIQGKLVGRNMAGANEPYNHLPYFFSDLFEFGYEAVGELDPSMEIYSYWKEENKKGIIYYVDDSKVRGVMLCNVWEKVDAARTLIIRNQDVTEGELRGAIGF
ncbi:MAG: FAD-dependent oxidoreductase [bacterium]